MKDWQIEDAARLKSLYKTITESTLDEFGSEYGIGSHGMVWQLLNGRRALTVEQAVAFAKGLGLKVDDFSPTIANNIRKYYQWVNPIDDDKIKDFDDLSPGEKARLQGFIKKLLDESGNQQN